MWKQFGKPQLRKPWYVRIPLAQASARDTPLRPYIVNSARRVYAVPTSNPVAKIRQSTSYSTPSTTTPCSVTRSTPFPLVSTNFTLGRLKVGRYSSLKVGRLHHCPYHGLSASAVAESLMIEETRPRISFIF